MNDARSPSPASARRVFLKKGCISMISAILGAVPFGASLAVFLDPLRRKAGPTNTVWVTNLEALPQDGVPRKFPVLATRVDAWNKFDQTHIGAVYLRRTPANEGQTFDGVCQHASCFVDFLRERGCYVCPRHHLS